MIRNRIINFFVFTLLSLVLLTNCERDDICAESTPTTPRIVIEFYDVSNPETLKSVNSLYIIGEDQTEAIEDDNGNTIRTTSSIALPLRTTDGTTTYTFVKNATVNNNGTTTDTTDDFIEGEFETIIFTYAPEEIYVSRACGFKTIYKNFIPEDLDDDDDWIQTSLRAEGITNIEDENQAHIYIRH